MQRFKVGELVVDAGTPILLEGSNSPQLFTALRGMGLRYRHLTNGERQEINFVFPGNFLGLQAGLMDRSVSGRRDCSTSQTWFGADCHQKCTPPFATIGFCRSHQPHPQYHSSGIDALRVATNSVRVARVFSSIGGALYSANSFFHRAVAR